MNKTEAKKRIKKLKEVIDYNRYLYHVLDKEDISQSALDSLKHELYNLEQEHPEFITPDSPSQRIGGLALKEFKKVEHEIPMLSIEDVFSEKELEDWENYLKRLMPGVQFEYFSELKIDGFAVTLIYENGIFKTGATRGNGKTGEDVTSNLKTIETVPSKLNIYDKLSSKEIKENLKRKIKNGKIEIRGEVYMEKKDFDKFNNELDKKGEKTYANPRNLAAGSIRQLNPALAASRPLKFMAYDIVTGIGQKKHSDEHQILPALGFKSGPGRITKNISEIINYWREIAQKREILPFQIDGLVISVNENSLFRKLGVVGKSPRGMRAFKFSPKQATTKILDIKVQVGRTGALTPITYLQPVKVGGVTVSRATLHNEDEIKRLGVKIGDTVIVERAGDVIPAVAKSLKKLRSGIEKEFHFPKTCPICGTELKKPEGEAVWRCLNRECSARKKENLYYFVSKKAFDIKGLGPKIIDRLLDENIISRAPDIFELKEGDLIPLERFADRSAQNLIRSIKESKKIPLARFIYALGIRHVGEETAIGLADYFGDIDKLKKASRDELERIPDIGEKAAESIYKWFYSQRNQKFVEDLFNVGVEILKTEKTGKKLKNKIFVFTGSLETMTRTEAEKRIRMFGGHPANSVSRQTDFLVAGSNVSSKSEKARKLGIKIINEKEFLRLIK